MTDSTSKAEAVDVPIDIEDSAAMRQFFTDVLTILADLQSRLDTLEELVTP